MSVWAKVVDRYLHYQPRSSERVKTVAPIPFTEILNAARVLSTLPSLQLNLLNGILKPFFNLVLSWHCIFWVFKEVVCFFFFYFTTFTTSFYLSCIQHPGFSLLTNRETLTDKKTQQLGLWFVFSQTEGIHRCASKLIPYTFQLQVHICPR